MFGGPIRLGRIVLGPASSGERRGGTNQDGGEEVSCFELISCAKCTHSMRAYVGVLVVSVVVFVDIAGVVVVLRGGARVGVRKCTFIREIWW